VVRPSLPRVKPAVSVGCRVHCLPFATPTGFSCEAMPCRQGDRHRRSDCSRTVRLGPVRSASLWTAFRLCCRVSARKRLAQLRGPPARERPVLALCACFGSIRVPTVAQGPAARGPFPGAPAARIRIASAAAASHRAALMPPQLSVRAQCRRGPGLQLRCALSQRKAGRKPRPRRSAGTAGGRGAPRGWHHQLPPAAR
jgi:hypothetical protein